MKYETKFIIKSNESLADNKIKSEIQQLLLKDKDGNNIHKQGKPKKKKQKKPNESCKFVLNLLQRLALTISNKHAALQNLFI